jgi:D-3-phosphoglycerate dehydrogenase
MKHHSGKVLIAAPVHHVLIDGLKGLGYECITMAHITQAIAPGAIHDCIGVITSTRLQLDKELLSSAPSLRWIGRMGSGMEVIDTDYAAEKGIACFSSPEGNSNAVAEHALGMLLGLMKKISRSNEEVKQGLWRREENRGYELEGKTIGIIGFGNTGSAFAKKLQGFDVRILAYDKYKPENIPSHIVNCKNLTPIYEEADIISFHVPMQGDTIHYLDDIFISNMSKSFILVNTSRGIVADSKAIWSGLQSGKIKGICLDVWEQEPIEKMDKDSLEIFRRITSLPQAIITPHIAGYSHEALYKMSEILLYKILNA